MKQSTHLYLLFRSAALKFLSPFFSHGAKGAIDLKTVKKVIIVTDFRLGDAVLSVPALNALKKAMPQCQLTVFCNQYSADVFGMVECVDAVVKYHDKKDFFENWKILRNISSEQFDVAIDLVQDYPLATAMWTLFSGAKYRVGYDWYGRGILFNIKISAMQNIGHVVDEMLGVCRQIGINQGNAIPEITVPKAAKEFVDKELVNAGIREEEWVIAIHPGGFYATQCWMPERFAEVAKLAIEKLKVRIVVLGTEHDRDRMKIITEHAGKSCIALFNYSIPNLAAILSHADCLLCNNSGALHLAAAVGTSTVSTMGPTVAERWWPKGEKNIVIRKDLPCIGCNSGICRIGTHTCMAGISADEVFQAVKKQISSHSGSYI
jgi:lipopolysaccharide heptosyltransferase II